jgi:murein DD-endopeptidase MepM/ murein hydrolase activator NlpD
MADSDPRKLTLPVRFYQVAGYHFGQRLPRHLILWATHLGDDILAEPGTPVQAIGAGEVVWSEMRLGTPEHRNWGGVVVVRHKYQEPTTKSQTNSKFKILNSKFFYSVYGHIHQLKVKEGDHVQPGQPVGIVAPGGTAENGWWNTPHLHFGIYTGPWKGRVLPGYARLDDWLRLSPRRTRVAWWHNPQHFIKEYNSLASRHSGGQA